MSLSGCYPEWLARLPVGIRVEPFLNPGNTSLHASSVVRSSQRGVETGVSFTGISPEDFEKLRPCVPPASAPQNPQGSEGTRPRSPRSQDRVCRGMRGRLPGLGSRPNDLPTTAEALEAVVHVPFRRGFLTRAELSEELENLKGVRI
jgi:hypothetical protein